MQMSAKQISYATVMNPYSRMNAAHDMRSPAVAMHSKELFLNTSVRRGAKNCHNPPHGHRQTHFLSEIMKQIIRNSPLPQLTDKKLRSKTI